MAISTAADTDYLVQDAPGSVAVRIGNTSGFGILDVEELSVLSDSGKLEVVGTRTTLTLREGKFSGLGQDVVVTAGGVRYLIRNIGTASPSDLGATRTLTIVKATP
jgi:hypothetical protein